MARRNRTDSLLSRRAANVIASSDAPSSHWMSSIATRTGWRAASPRSALRTPAATAWGSLGSSASARRSATSSARACGVGRCTSASSATGPSRSASPTKVSRASAELAVLARTRYPSSRAFSSNARQIAVFPIPGGPSMTSTRSRPASRKVRPERISRSRSKSATAIDYLTPCPLPEQTLLARKSMHQRIAAATASGLRASCSRRRWRSGGDPEV